GVETQAVEGIAPRPVARVSEHRMAELRELDPDLMAPTRAEPDRQARHVGAPLEHAVPRDRDAGAPALRRRPAGGGGGGAGRTVPGRGRRGACPRPPSPRPRRWRRSGAQPGPPRTGPGDAPAPPASSQ